MRWPWQSTPKDEWEARDILGDYVPEEVNVIRTHPDHARWNLDMLYKQWEEGKKRMTCPRCGAEGRVSPTVWAYSSFPHFRVEGFPRRFYISCRCDECLKTGNWNCHFDVEFTKQEALAYEAWYDDLNKTPIVELE